MRGEKGLVFIVNARGCEGFKQGCGCLSLSNTTGEVGEWIPEEAGRWGLQESSKQSGSGG